MLNDVNTYDLGGAVALGCRAMANALNADDHEMPFFTATAWPVPRLEFSPYHGESHVPGRHLNAMLNARELGIPVDEHAVRCEEHAAFFSFSGPAPLPMNRKAISDPVPNLFVDHNCREGLFALYALSRFERNEEADRLAREMIAWIGAHYLPDTAGDSDFAWDGTLAELGVETMSNPIISGVGRMSGPLVKYWQSSGYAPALDLASALADRAVMHYPEDGSFDQQKIGTTHVHSITCVLSSLAQLADASGDSKLLARVKAFYDKGLNELHNTLGWCFENTERRTGRGEVNNSGDVLETALILGRHYGASYYEDAERFIRAHILPSQLRDISFIAETNDPDAPDGCRLVGERLRGAFGFPAPYGHYPKRESDAGGNIPFNLDIVGGTCASLCEAMLACTSFENGNHRVQLWFDRETDHIRVRTDYTAGKIYITVKAPGSLCVRIPSWLDRSTVTCGSERKGTLCGSPESRIEGDWLVISEPPPGEEISIRFSLPEREILLPFGTGALRARLRGDQVCAMENEGMPFTFFPDLQ